MQILCENWRLEIGVKDRQQFPTTFQLLGKFRPVEGTEGEVTGGGVLVGESADEGGAGRGQI